SPSTKPVIHSASRFTDHPERIVSEGSLVQIRAFPADCPHVRQLLTARGSRASTGRLCEEFPAYSSVLLMLASSQPYDRDSYGLRLLGLQFRALACAEPLSLTFRHRAGVPPYTSPHRLSREMCFW